MSQSQQQWADLPKELLETIAGRLDSHVDILRFRSVCRSWRSVRCFRPETPPLVLNLPLTPLRAVLSQYSICRLELPHHQDPASSSSSSSSSPPPPRSKGNGWLTKVRDSGHGKLKLLHPFSSQKTACSPLVLNLNLLDVSLVHLSTAFVLKALDGDKESPFFRVRKALLFPASASFTEDGFSILAILHEGKLGYWKYGDDNWTLLDDNNFQYDDIVMYKGQFYAVDQWGTVSWVDSSLRVIQYAPPLNGCGVKKNLVESCGDLYVVDRYLHRKRRIWNCWDAANEDADPSRALRDGNFRKSSPKGLDFRVYKLDEEWGTWVDVKSLGDRAFFLGVDCSFSVSSGEFVGGKGNCIYFIDDDVCVGKGVKSDDVLVFKLEDRSIEQLALLPEYSQIFWPPNCPLDWPTR